MTLTIDLWGTGGLCIFVSPYILETLESYGSNCFCTEVSRLTFYTQKEGFEFSFLYAESCNHSNIFDLQSVLSTAAIEFPSSAFIIKISGFILCSALVELGLEGLNVSRILALSTGTCFFARAACAFVKKLHLDRFTKMFISLPHSVFMQFGCELQVLHLQCSELLQFEDV